VASNVETGAPADVSVSVRREGRPRVGQGLTTFGLIGPTVIALAIFFLAPLWYIFEFSTGLKYFAPRPALAVLNGELTAFSGALWSKFFGSGVELIVMPNIGSGAKVTFPAILLGIAFVVLILGAVMGSKLGERARLISGVCFVLLLLPFLTIPFGNTLVRVAQFSSESTDLRLFFKSVSMATTSSVIAVLIAFPVAYYLAFCVEKTKYTWLLIVITPFLTSYLLRIFAWKVVLGDQGLINSGLASLGIISKDQPLSFLIYSQFTVMIVLTYAWVPFICLPIFISLENMDRKLLEAATDLGASRLKAFSKITLPLAAPGIVAAFLFVFIPSIGEYITPSLVGGTRGYMFGQAVADHFVGGAFDWQGGSVLALFLLTVVLFLTAATSKFLRAGGGTA
jgi:ABC-type spermidine/putrescine transport system permease subunit I